MPTFTQKHYSALAEFIAGMNSSETERAKLAQRLAQMLAKDNPRFDEWKWDRACGVQP